MRFFSILAIAIGLILFVGAVGFGEHGYLPVIGDAILGAFNIGVGIIGLQKSFR